MNLSYNEVIKLLDEMFAMSFGWRPEELKVGKVAFITDGKRMLTFGMTCSRGFVVTNLIDESALRVAVRDRRPDDLCSQQMKQRLIALLPRRGKPLQVSDNVLLFCTRDTFSPQDSDIVRLVAPDDVLWMDADGKRREVAFAVYQEGKHVTNATLSAPSDGPFRSVTVGTHPAHRGKGYAKACVSAVTRYALEHDLIPLYNTQTCNVASLAVARSIGYREYFLCTNVAYLHRP